MLMAAHLNFPSRSWQGEAQEALLSQAGCLRVVAAETRSLRPSRQGWARGFTAGDTAVARRLPPSSSTCSPSPRDGDPRAGLGQPGGRKVFPAGGDVQFRAGFLPMFPVLSAFQALRGLSRLSLQCARRWAPL